MQYLHCTALDRTWIGQHGHVRNHNQHAHEVALVPGLRRLHGLGPQNDLHAAGNGASRQLSLRLLDTHLPDGERLGRLRQQLWLKWLAASTQEQRRSAVSHKS